MFEHRWLSALWVGLVLAGVVSEAQAYCRQTTCDPEREGTPCERGADDCVSEGLPLFYETPCLGFGVAKGSGEQLGFSDKEFLSLAEQAFERWASVDCGDGETPGFVVQPGVAVKSSSRFFCEAAPELNLSVWSFEAPWPYPGARNALGFTTSSFDVNTGRVFDADVELNLPKVANSNVPAEGLERQVLAIMTHEAGHFLGLAHSNDLQAVMAAMATESDLLNKELTQDDIDGICAIYPPDDAPKSCSELGVSDAALSEEACESAMVPIPSAEGCSVTRVSGSPSSGAWPWLGLIVFGWAARRASLRSRRRSGPRDRLPLPGLANGLPGVREGLS